MFFFFFGSKFVTFCLVGNINTFLHAVVGFLQTVVRDKLELLIVWVPGYRPNRGMDIVPYT